MDHRPLGDALDVLPDVILVVDAESRTVLDVNRSEGMVLGHPVGHLRSSPLAKLFSDDAPWLTRGASDESPAIVTLFRMGDHRLIPVDVRLRTLPDGRLVLVCIRIEPARAQIEDEFRKVNRYLDAIVENIPDMIFVKDAKTLLFQRFNRAGEELLGWSRAELLGKTDHDFYPKEQADFFHLKDRETLRNKKLVDIPEEPIETRSQGLRWLHTKKVPVCDDDGNPLYLLGISEDITEKKAAVEARRRAEEHAHAVERELASVVRHARDAIVTWSLVGTIVSVNPAAERLYGRPASSLIGTSITTLIPDALRAEFDADQQRLLAGERVPVAETWRIGASGDVEVEEGLFVVNGPDGKPGRIASTARDVGELARLRRATQILGASAHAAPAGSEETRSAKMRKTLEEADILARDAQATVLILGETGVGKGWLARRMHEHSPRADKPFFEVNCATLGANLVESELFGHERGAFTGANAQKRGIVEVADGGTLFLDEIAELPLGVQAQLLTFLDKRSFRRVGGTRNMVANVRLLAATNVDLKKAVERGTFRRDLLYRLTIVPIMIPPLRERREDIPLIANQLLSELVRSGDGRTRHLTPRVTAALTRYAWPGNVRELRNALERAVILSRGEAIELDHMPPELRGLGDGPSGPDDLASVEKQHILRILERVQDNRTLAAEVLGISRSTLKRKLAEYHLDEE